MAIGIAYSGTGGTHNVVFREFLTQSIPRQYESTTSFTRSASGASILAGNSGVQKRIWVVSAHVTQAEAQELDDMFAAWDTDRANGQTVGCGLTDTCWGPTINATVIFSTPPSYIYINPKLAQVDFAVTEV